jgi:hypothetical protein
MKGLALRGFFCAKKYVQKAVLNPVFFGSHSYIISKK